VYALMKRIHYFGRTHRFAPTGDCKITMLVAFYLINLKRLVIQGRYILEINFCCLSEMSDFWSIPRKTKILTADIHVVFRGLKF